VEKGRGADLRKGLGAIAGSGEAYHGAIGRNVLRFGTAERGQSCMDLIPSVDGWDEGLCAEALVRSPGLYP